MAKRRAANQPGDLWLDARYIDNHVLLTATDAWTYMVLPGLATNTPTSDDLESMINGVEKIIDGLGASDPEIHYYKAFRDVDPTEWAGQLHRTATAAQPAWSGYVERMANRLIERGYKRPVLYLGVRLGRRKGAELSSLRQSTPGQIFRGAWNYLASAAAGPDPQPSADEVAAWREAATKTRRALRLSQLRAAGASASDVAWLIRHVQRIGMPEGPAEDLVREWGAGSVHDLAESTVENKADPTRLSLQFTGRNKRLNQHLAAFEQASAAGATLLPPETFHTSHLAVLSASHFPDETGEPWLFHATKLPFAVEVSARVRLITDDQAEKALAKAINKQTNALKDAKDADVEAHGRDKRRARQAHDLQSEVAGGRNPRQVVSTYRLIVSGQTRAQLGARCEELIRHYREEPGGAGITLSWSPTDQYALWQETIPGQATRTRLSEQQQDLKTFTVSLPFSVSEAGDGTGPYLGTILTGTPTPLFYDLAFAAASGRAPTIALTGTLGGGKTWCLNTLLDHFRLRGYPLFALDYKGDLKGHLMLRGRGDVRFFDLTRDGRPGASDPFTVVPCYVDPEDPARATAELADETWRQETRVLVRDIIDQLLHDDYSSEMRTIVSITLDTELQQQRPAMAHFIEMLRNGGADPYDVQIGQGTRDQYRMAALGAYATLNAASQSVLGRLMFAPAASESAGGLFAGDVRTTIVDLSGLDLPKDGQPPSSPQQRFSAALFSLVAYQARRMLQDMAYVGPRALIIDEAHQILSLPSGKSLVVSNARMGRSKDLAMILATQSTVELLDDALRNVIGAVFAFRTGGRAEREDVAVLLGREPDDPMVAETLPDASSPAGFCLFRDLNNNVVPVRIDAWAEEYTVPFETNPDRKNVSAAGRKIITDRFGVVRDPDSVRNAAPKLERTAPREVAGGPRAGAAAPAREVSPRLPDLAAPDRRTASVPGASATAPPDLVASASPGTTADATWWSQ